MPNDYEVKMKQPIQPGQPTEPNAMQSGTDVAADEKSMQVQKEMVKTLENIQTMISKGQTEQAITLIQQEIQRLGGPAEQEAPEAEDESELSAQLMKALS